MAREEPEETSASAAETVAPPKHTLRESDLAEHIPIIRNYLRKLVRKGEIEDAVQTVLARALESLHKYRGDSTPRVWLLGIARNVGFEQGRRRSKAPLLASKEQDEATLAAGGSAPPEPTQEEVLGRKEQQALALRVLDGLSLDEKLALLVTYVDELPGREAADLLGVSFAAFRQRLARARKAMRKELEKMLENGEEAGSAQVLADWMPVLDPKGTAARLSESD